MSCLRCRNGSLITVPPSHDHSSFLAALIEESQDAIGFSGDAAAGRTNSPQRIFIFAFVSLLYGLRQ